MKVDSSVNIKSIDRTQTAIGFCLFLALFLLVNMHILRNLTPLYLLFLGTTCSVTVVFSIILVRSMKLDVIGLSILAYGITGALAAGYTCYSYGMNSGLYASTRYFFAFPLALAAYASVNSERRMKVFLFLFVLVIAIGTLTVPLQFFTGPISWFSEPSERAGLIRYASAFGSLTPVGIVAPMAFFLLLSMEINKWIKIVLSLVLVTGMILSLQKSALVGLVFSATLYFLMFPKRVSLKHIAAFLLGILILVLVLGILSHNGNLPILDALTYLYASTGVAFEQAEIYRGADDTVIQSVVRRFTELPGNSLNALFEKMGLLGFVVGGGFDMMGNSLMKENETDFIMPHNNLVDLIVVGGIYHFLAFFGILFGMARKVRLNIRNTSNEKGISDLYRAIYGFLILYVVNLPFTSGMNFHPNISSIFWVIAGFVGSQDIESGRFPTSAS